MSSRDFSFSHYNNYRPHQPNSGSGPRDRSSQWDQGRGGFSRVSSGDYDRDRERDRDRTYDRDRDRDRERDRRTEPRDRELSRRDSDLSWSQAPQNQSPKMAPDRAAAELAKCLRALCDIMNRKVQLSNKRDIEIKASKKREQDYSNKIAGAKQFPALNDLYAKHSRHHKEIVESIDKELATLTASYQNVTDNFADTLVKALPINEIKTRQIIDTAKGELDREITSSQVAQGGRFQKLEDLVNSLKEKHEAQDQELTKLKRLNDKLRAGENTAGALDKEKEQLRSENLALKKTLDALAERLESVEAWKAGLPDQMNSQKTEILDSLEQAKAEWSNTPQLNPNALQDDTLHEQIAALGKKDDALSAGIAGLRKDVDGHEDLLANVDIEALDDTIAKVSEYPKYNALNDRVATQQAEVNNLKDSLQSTKQELEKDLGQKFTGFSGKVVDYCGQKFVDIERRVKDLEAAKSSESEARSTEVPLPQPGVSDPAPILVRVTALASDVEGIASGLNAADTRLAANESRIDANEANANALQSKTDALRTDMVAIRGQVDQRCGALETMVESLDDQWKNMTTTQMAQCIFDQLSRLQPSQLTPEMRQFHARLADVEKLIHYEKQERLATRDQVRALCLDNLDQGTKRVSTGDEEYPGFKRMRIEGVNNVDGFSNGHDHP